MSKVLGQKIGHLKPQKKYCVVNFLEQEVNKPMNKEEMETYLKENADDIDIENETVVLDMTTGKKYKAIVTKQIKLEEVKE